MEQIISFEELKQSTSQVREEKKKQHSERIKLGSEDAIKHITQGCSEKMKESASKGFDRVVIYTVKWVKNPDDTHDEDGNKAIFEGNVRLSDLLTKSKNEFLSDLNIFFNGSGEQNYQCGVFKGTDSWNIYVSWDFNNSRGGGGGGGGRGRGGGRNGGRTSESYGRGKNKSKGDSSLPRKSNL